MKLRLWALALLGAATACHAAEAPAPLPDVPGLLREVEAHQKQLDKVREDYTFHEVQRTEELDGKGKVRKTRTGEYEVFFVNGHAIERKTGEDGHPLAGNDEKKESERVRKRVEKAEKTPPGQSLEHDEVTVTRLLQIISVGSPRRLVYQGRPAIAFDFTGNPKADTHGFSENLSKKLSGTMWIDEADRQVARIDAHVNDDFRIGGGVFLTLQKGSNFHFEQALVNRELWLPVGADIHFDARAFLVKGFHANVHVTDDNYQKFHASASQLPGATVVPPAK